MSASDSASPRNHDIRRDGWTPERQLRFLDALERSRSVVKAAAAAGMSRTSAYRLRSRCDGLFALLWDRAVQGSASSPKVHTGAHPDGLLARLLGNHYRRESGDFLTIGSAGTASRAG